MAFNKAVRNRNQLTRFTNKSAQGEVLAADTADSSVVANTSVKYALVVRKITCNVYVGHATAIATFQSDGAGGDPIFTLQAPTTALGEHKIDFGELGYQLPVGEGLEISLSIAGLAFTYVAEVYYIPAATMTPAEMTN